MSESLRARLYFLLAVLGMATVIGLLSSACFGDKKVTSAPALVIASDKDFRAAEMKSLGILETLGSLLDQASALEQAGSSALPPGVHQRIKDGLKATAQKGLDLVNDIDKNALKDWAALKARLDPILTDIEALRNLVVPTGTSKWVTIIETVFNIAAPLLFPAIPR
jgi:enoyl-CoA hydratase/carnithine racemase